MRVCRDGWSALIYASLGGHISCVEALGAHKADVQHCDQGVMGSVEWWMVMRGDVCSGGAAGVGVGPGPGAGGGPGGRQGTLGWGGMR